MVTLPKGSRLGGGNRTPDRKFVDKEGSRSNDGEVDAGGSASAVERIRCGTTVRFSYPHVCFVKLRVEHVLRDTKLRRISTVSWGWRGGMKYSAYASSWFLSARRYC